MYHVIKAWPANGVKLGNSYITCNKNISNCNTVAIAGNIWGPNISRFLRILIIKMLKIGSLILILVCRRAAMYLECLLFAKSMLFKVTDHQKVCPLKISAMNGTHVWIY